MTIHLSWRALGALLLGVALGAPAPAHEGHDHGDEAPAAALPALAPRTEAASDLFELLAVLDGAQLVLWIDSFDSNVPVAGARVEVEGQGWKAVAAAAPDGAYRVAPPKALGPGSHALVFTVQAGPDADLLEATLAVPRPAAAQETPVSSGVGVLEVRSLGLGAAAVLGLGIAALLWRGRRRPATQEAA